MIALLHIKNIGIIDDLTVEFNEGLNILTGETGSGKSLIINSLNIISGDRFSKEMMKKESNFSLVEVCFYLPNHPDNEDGNVIVSREIYENGRNICKINGRIITVSQLKQTVSNILDIHGQHDNQSLLDISNHIQILDDFASEELLNVKKEYKEKYAQYVELKSKLKENYGNDEEKQRTLDLLKYQLDEIINANLKPNEEEKLEEKKKIVLNSQKIINALNISSDCLDSNVLDNLSNVLSQLDKVSNLNEEYEKIYNVVQNSYYELEEASRQIDDLKNNMFFDEEEQNNIQERLNTIFNLKRKYGNTIEKILEYKETIQNEIQKIENLEEYIENLKKQINNIEAQMYILSQKMHEYREKHSKVLENQINLELKDLNMKNALFKVNIQQNDKYNLNGLDNIEFLIRTNLGEDFKPLIKIASGGEISRIMLAIKKVLSDIDRIPVIIFDEIDTGISGESGNVVGEKMKYISKNHQVLCITHLANIAAKGDHNYYISKQDIDGHTITKIKKLNEEETIKEIARISSGQITDVSIEYAKQLRHKKVTS